MIDAESVKQILLDELKQPSLKKWINGTVNVMILRKFRNWKEHHDRHCPVNLATLLLQTFFSFRMGVGFTHVENKNVKKKQITGMLCFW